mgnify:CR=1 FL=1
MIGAGIFVALAPAAAAAGSGLLIGLAVAAVVAYCNATSSARLAARYPQSGGTYVYGRERLGEFWGYTAGWSFVVGKTASCAAMALTVGIYAWPAYAHAIAVAAVVALTAVNYAGIQKSALLTRVIVAIVLAVLAAVVVIVLGFGDVDASRSGVRRRRQHRRGSAGGRPVVLRVRGIRPDRHPGRGGVATPHAPSRWRSRLRSASRWRSTRSSPWRCWRSWAAPDWRRRVLRWPTPCGPRVTPASNPWFVPGLAVAALGSLLSLILGVSRTMLAMARD